MPLIVFFVIFLLLGILANTGIRLQCTMYFLQYVQEKVQLFELRKYSCGGGQLRNTIHWTTTTAENRLFHIQLFSCHNTRFLYPLYKNYEKRPKQLLIAARLITTTAIRHARSPYPPKIEQCQVKKPRLYVRPLKGPTV